MRNAFKVKVFSETTIVATSTGDSEFSVSVLKSRITLCIAQGLNYHQSNVHFFYKISITKSWLWCLLQSFRIRSRSKQKINLCLRLKLWHINGAFGHFFLDFCGFNLQKLRFWTLVREVVYVVYCHVYSWLCNLLRYTQTITLLSSFSGINAGSIQSPAGSARSIRKLECLFVSVFYLKRPLLWFDESRWKESEVFHCLKDTGEFLLTEAGFSLL